MANEILIGTEGWQHAAWREVFYPEELPREWEFCYYSNRLRALWVPADVTASATASDIAQWLQDSDPAFRFVLSVAATRAVDGVWLAEFGAHAAMLKSRLAGIVLVGDIDLPANRLAAMASVLRALAPVCVDVPVGTGVNFAALNYAPYVWHAQSGSAPPWIGAPLDGQALCLARMTDGNPRLIRHVLEQLAAAPTVTAGLFFSPSAAAPDYAEQARTLAELLAL